MTLTQKFIDNSNKEKHYKHAVQLVVACADSAEALVPAEKALDLVTLFVEFFVMLPWAYAVFLWRDNRAIA